MKFKSGFAWFKYNGFSYIGKIEKRHDNGTYDVSCGLQGGGSITLEEVPESELTAIRGDE